MVITIIIIIILATVTIKAVFGEGGLIKQAQLSKDIAANSIVAEDEYLNRLMQEHANLLGEDGKLPIGSIIPIENYEQLLKIGSGEEIEINGIIYKFDLGKTYELQNDIEFTGYYDDIANLIKNNEVEFRGQDHKIVVTIDNGIKEYYTEESKYYIATNKYGYVSRGLEIYYDGIDNTGSGHSSSTTTWKDLSGNNRNGTLKNMTASNAWGSEGLKFDGIDDYVLIAEMNYDNITMEAVATKGLSKKSKCIIANLESGGYQLATSGNYGSITFSAYIVENSNYITTPVYQNESSRSERNSLSGSYDRNTMKLRTSNESGSTFVKSDVPGTIGKPLNKTYLVLGTNPSGTQGTAEYYDGEMSSIRIYNRALSDEESAVNLLNDRDRYKV